MKAKSLRICLLPRFREGDLGGVATHIRALTRHLQLRGHELVSQPADADIVHGHATVNAGQLDVFTCHGVYPIKANMPRWQIAANKILFDNLKLAGEVIAVSRWTAAQWQHLIGRQPHIIYNAVDLAVWQNIPRGTWRSKLGVAPTTPLVLWGKAGISEVLDPTAFVELALRTPGYHFVTPLPVNALRQPPKNLTCVGAQSFASMQQLIADCDVYLATVQENHSIQVLEAMALAKPVLGYAWGGTTETVPPGGILVAPGDMLALSAALPDVFAQRQALGRAGQAHVAEHFGIQQQIDKLEEVYVTVMETRRKRGPVMPTKCSIVIPVYNKAAFITETLRSALRQGIAAPKYEIIVVNDGSTDDSLDILRHLVADMPGQTNSVHGTRKIHIYDRPNAGVAAARNFGIQQALGEYICCLDADDLIDTHFLERLSAALDADPGLGIAYSDFVAFGHDAQGQAFEAPITCDAYDFETLKQHNLLPCCNLFRKTAWERAGGYKDINPSWEDYELWLNMGKLGWYGQRVPGMLFRYRKVPQTGRDHASHGQEWRLRGIVNKHHRDLYPPLISVIIPCYQYSQFLRAAIDSVRSQTLPDHEVVVVDDGNDEVEAEAIRRIVDDYVDADVRVVRLATNSGLAAARNYGIELARGQWLVPLDADDKLAPDALERLWRATEMNQLKFAYSDTYLWYPAEGDRLQRLDAEAYDFETMLAHISWGCTIMYHRKAWSEAGGYKVQMSDAGGWEDWEFAIQLGRNGVCGEHVSEPLFYYRQHSAAQMRKRAEENKPRLQETLRRLHADLYRGERPMACCGSKKNTLRAAPAAPRDIAVTTVRDITNAALIRYTGPRMGEQTWRTPSGHAYRFKNGTVQTVPSEDVAFFVSLPDFVRVTA